MAKLFFVSSALKKLPLNSPLLSRFMRPMKTGLKSLRLGKVISLEKSLLLSSIIVLVLISLYMGALILFLNKQNQVTLKTLSSTYSASNRQLIDLLSKQTSLLSTKTPLEYQAVQAMENPAFLGDQFAEVDLTDHAEILRTKGEGVSDADALDAADERRFAELHFPSGYGPGANI